MEALVLGRPGFERTTLGRFLNAAGHRVRLCHDSNWGCVGMDDVCPLDECTIDVAIARLRGQLDMFADGQRHLAPEVVGVERLGDEAEHLAHEA